MRLCWPIAALAALLWAPAVEAQDRSVYPGDRVRVTDARRWTGMVTAVGADTIHVVPEGESSPRPLALASLERLEISLGEAPRGRSFLIGGLVGAGTGAGVAAIVSARHTCEPEPDDLGLTPACETVGPVAIVASSVIGFALGGAIGTLLGRGERWVRAAAPARVGSVRLELRLLPPGAQLSRSDPIRAR